MMNEAVSAGFNENEQYAKLPPLKGAAPRELAEALRDILDMKKGRDIKVLHVGDKTPIADYFVLCTGNSTTQIKGLAEEVEFKTSLRGLPPQGVEGRGNGSWVLLDYGSVIVHIFSQQAREFYNLDKLYGSTEIAISDNQKRESNEIQS